jgi:hypothetical protein
VEIAGHFDGIPVDLGDEATITDDLSPRSTVMRTVFGWASSSIVVFSNL